MKTGTRVLLGAAIFGAGALYHVPDFLHGAWGEALLLFAALVVVPLVMDLVVDPEDDASTAKALSSARQLQFGAAVCLALAYALRPGFPAALAAAPWAGVLCLLAAAGLRRLVKRGSRPLARLSRDVGLVYAAVGAAWLMCDRTGFRPLGFDPSIVLLTAVHFHYAGLLLPVLTSFALVVVEISHDSEDGVMGAGEVFVGVVPSHRALSAAISQSRGVGAPRLHRGLAPDFGSVVAGGIVAGVPAVAIGITATQLGLTPQIEVAATALMALSGFAVAMIHVRLALQSRWPSGIRLLWLVAGLSLGAGMALALLYGLRYFFRPLPWLDLPWMRAMHGSLNALGFGFFGALAWNALARQKNVSVQRAPEKTR